jgi:hypothetical protein
MKKSTDSSIETEYPSIELAYPIAVASYEVAAKRIDAMDNKLQTMLAFIVTVSVSVPTIANAKGVNFKSVWFYSATLFFAFSIALGIYARLAGNMRVLKPSKLFDGWLADKPAEFMKDMIYHAGEDFNANLELVNRRWRYLTTITILFIAEAVCLTVWVLYRYS